jgi:hypothetical protein
MSADDVMWMVYGFPPELTLTHALVLTAGGAPVARLIAASAAGSDRPAIDTFVEHSFSSQIDLPLDVVTPIPAGSAIVLNGAHPVWTEIEGAAVMRAEQEIDGNLQWAWSADGVVWIVRGTVFAEDYVRSLLRVHAASLAQSDTQGLLGDLWIHKPTVPDMRYYDAPRSLTLASLSGRLFPLVCSERFYVGALVPEGTMGSGAGPDDLGLMLEKAGNRCVTEGLIEQVGADVAAALPAEQIGGLTVYRHPQFIVALLDDVIVTLSSGNPRTLIDMAPLIEQFFASQPR